MKRCLAIGILAALIFGGSSPSFAACSGPTGAEGDMIYNSSHHMMQFCNGSDWVAMAGSGGGGGGSANTCPPESYFTGSTDNQPIAGFVQNGYYFLIEQNTDSIIAYSLGPTAAQVGTGYTFTQTDPSSIWGDGTYLYVGSGNYLYALSFNGSAFTATSINTSNAVQDVWGAGGYIFIANAAAGVKAYTFNGTTLAQAGSTYNTPGDAQSIWGRSATEIFVADGTSGLRALSFDGSTFTSVGTWDPGEVNAVYATASHVFTSNADPWYSGSILTYSGGAFTEVVTDYFTVVPFIELAIGSNLYSDGRVFTLSGATLTQVGSYATLQDEFWTDPNNATATDGSYLYTAEWLNLQISPVCD